MQLKKSLGMLFEKCMIQAMVKIGCTAMAFFFVLQVSDLFTAVKPTEVLSFDAVAVLAFTVKTPVTPPQTV